MNDEFIFDEVEGVGFGAIRRENHHHHLFFRNFGDIVDKLPGIRCFGDAKWKLEFIGFDKLVHEIMPLLLILKLLLYHQKVLDRLIPDPKN
jgi:hypothetical protein